MNEMREGERERESRVDRIPSDGDSSGRVERDSLCFIHNTNKLHASTNVA